jgi:hypothetical protein
LPIHLRTRSECRGVEETTGPDRVLPVKAGCLRQGLRLLHSPPAALSVSDQLASASWCAAVGRSPGICASDQEAADGHEHAPRARSDTLWGSAVRDPPPIRNTLENRPARQRRGRGPITEDGVSSGRALDYEAHQAR